MCLQRLPQPLPSYIPGVSWARISICTKILFRVIATSRRTLIASKTNILMDAWSLGSVGILSFARANLCGFSHALMVSLLFCPSYIFFHKLRFCFASNIANEGSSESCNNPVKLGNPEVLVNSCKATFSLHICQGFAWRKFRKPIFKAIVNYNYWVAKMGAKVGAKRVHLGAKTAKRNTTLLAKK